MKQNIFISYSDEDKALAEQLKSILTERFGETVWLRDFDLNAGDTLAEVIPEVVADTKWFILLYSKYSKESRWVKWKLILHYGIGWKRKDLS